MLRFTSSLAALAVLMAPAALRAADAPTFAKDVAPILNANCVECHRTGQGAPMNFTSYEEARPWAKAVKKAVESGQMPPWHADPAVGQWKNDRRMKAADIATIAKWVDAGAPMGDPKDLPPAPEFANAEWNIGTPDMIFTMAREEVLPPTLQDEYRYVFIPTGLKEERWLSAAEAKPGNRDVVHHIITFVTTTDAMAKMMGGNRKKHPEGTVPETQHGPQGGDRRGPEGDGGPAGMLQSFLGGYAPGMGKFVMEPGEAMYLPPNSVLVLQMHYHKDTGLEARDKSSIAVKFADYPVVKQKRMEADLSNFEFAIPANVADHPVDASMTVKKNITMQEIMPHMHVRGKSMKVWAKFPDGTQRDLINVPAYDFNWQFFYKFQEPLKIPAGTQLFANAIYDNSTGNPNNPDPNKTVRFGLPTTDEMMFAFFLYTEDEEALNVRDSGAGAAIPGGAGN